jgi:hypothetical protein
MSWIDWLEHHLLSCPSKYFLGVDCPGCGMQTAFIQLLRGNFLQSLKIYPGLIPVIVTLLILAVHIKFKFENGARMVQYSFMISAGVIVISYIIKQVHIFTQ